MPTIEEFIEKNSKFVTFKDELVHKLKYVSHQVIRNPFDKGTEVTDTVEYSFVENENEKTYMSQNIGFAQLMIGKEGKTLDISHKGKTWAVDEVKEDK